jgi:hypothetical protein
MSGINVSHNNTEFIEDRAFRRAYPIVFQLVLKFSIKLMVMKLLYTSWEKLRLVW